MQNPSASSKIYLGSRNQLFDFYWDSTDWLTETDYSFTYANMCVFVCAWLYVRVYVYIYMYVICVYVYIYIYVYVYICMHIYIYIYI